MNTIALTKVVNVATVPQRSPFRYPGGETWLVPHVRLWFSKMPRKPSLFIEPFAGGAIVSLTVAFEDLADRVLMVELDDQVASVWQTVLNGEAEWLADRILNFTLTNETLARELSKEPQSRQELAFQTMLRNRTNHGGILAPGTGTLKHGENGKGILSRWYPKTLSKRLRDISNRREKLRFKHADGLEVMSQYVNREDAVFFIDPPYTVSKKRAGSRLYKYFQVNHGALFELVGKITGDFLMTYDNCEEVRQMAIQSGFDFEAIPMKNTHHTKMTRS